MVPRADTFLTVEGVKGDSRHPKYPGAISVQYFSWQSRQSSPVGSTHLGGTVARGYSNTALRVSMFPNPGSPELMRMHAAGRTIPGAVLDVLQAAGVKLRITLTNVIVAEFSRHAAGIGRPMPVEQVDLIYQTARSEEFPRGGSALRTDYPR